jgi:hypothetical protein
MAQVLEGTWEEIERHKAAFVGHRLQIVIDPVEDAEARAVLLRLPPGDSADVLARDRTEYDPIVADMITPTVRPVLERVLDEMTRYVASRSVPLVANEVTGFHDPEDNSGHLFLIQWVESDSERVWQYSDELNDHIEQWANSVLTPREAYIAIKQLPIEARSEAQDA